MKSSLKLLSDELTDSQMDEEFTETDLGQWRRRLKRLADDLVQLSNVKIKYDKDNMSDEIRLIRPKFIQTNGELLEFAWLEDSSFASVFRPTINPNATWRRNGTVVAGKTSSTNVFHQLNQPFGIDIDNDGTLFIADSENHRIVAWKANENQGEVIAGGKGKGNTTDQLDTPGVVLIDRINSCLIISEIGNRRISRWSLQQKEPKGEVIISNIISWGLA